MLFVCVSGFFVCMFGKLFRVIKAMVYSIFEIEEREKERGRKTEKERVGKREREKTVNYTTSMKLISGFILLYPSLDLIT